MAFKSLSMIGSMTKPWMLGDTPMRRDLRLLCWMLRHEFVRDGKKDLWDTIVHLRRLAVRHESGDLRADTELADRFSGLSLDELDEQLRLLGLFFDFANVSEDLQRERVLQERRRGQRLNDGLDQRLQQFQTENPHSDTRTHLLSRLQAEFVFTAHPTEAKRQTVRRTLGRIRDNLRRLDGQPARTQRAPLLQELREDVRFLLRTDPLHPHRPEVLEELDRALYVSDVLWNASSTLVECVDSALGEASSPLKFGCWIGGDRDGHPHVTADITRETLQRLRTRACEFHLQECQFLLERMAVRCRHPDSPPLLESIVKAASGEALDSRLSRLHPREYFRRALKSIQFRLLGDSPEYACGSDLEHDLDTLAAAMRLEGLEGLTYQRVLDWRRRTRVFGLHLMRLDIRENSKGYRALVKSLLSLLGEDPGRVDHDRFDDLWDRSFDPVDDTTLRAELDERAYDLFAVTRLMMEWADGHSAEGIGVNVISMTHGTGDVLRVLWLHKLIRQWNPQLSFSMPIAPLFETIDDLQRAAGILDELFRHPVYRAWLTSQDQRQTVMVGYSDSAKDGGYLAACWALYSGQAAMQRVAAEHRIQLICFHGRGGALGRGGGPAARAIQALPPTGNDAHIRMTEQGEVIADRFAAPTLAHRHMEQILGGLVLHAGRSPAVKSEWKRCIEDFAAIGREAYLKLFEHPGFTEYFRGATPIRCIENLPIGSRPSRRHGVQSLEDLRAIPYTFSWTQSRQLINAFYGLGSAWEKLGRKQRLLCLDMYRDWPFFRSMIDNAELALTKCDAGIAAEYAKLVPDSAIGDYFGGEIGKEIERTRKAILSITERPSLMAETAWLRRSVEIRKPFIDILNHIQIELLRRQNDTEHPEGLERSLRLSVQGIAAGLRTTG